MNRPQLMSRIPKRLKSLILCPVINPGDAVFDLLQQFVICGDLAVDVSLLGDNALSLHLAGGNAHVDGGDFFNFLPLIAAVIYPLRSARRLPKPSEYRHTCTDIRKRRLRFFKAAVVWVCGYSCLYDDFFLLPSCGR